ncbi:MULTISPECIES: hypothetical protein [unclassified Roseobacter]|uniref:hypothetical protein n=1 Tax=unclassified Roseobacter TaxID=196798 RepID=UPI001491E6A8|nr:MULTISPECIES: hypothetical protein [unclassified Roseobacter]NNW55460.1 hypothetical protein [Roseobacter sp. HKCCD8284]NNY17299.1 hypothetical protein [Roseobacter sp. HKCCD8191]
MAKYDLNLPETFDVSAGGSSVTVKVSALTEELIARLVLHGLRQKVADAAASAKKLSEADDETRDKMTIAGDLMSKVATTLERGEWGVERGAGGSADPLDRFRLAIVRDQMKRPGNEDVKKAYDAIASDDQAKRRAFLMDIAGKNAEAIDPAAQSLYEQDQKRKAEAAKISIDL